MEAGGEVTEVSFEDAIAEERNGEQPEGASRPRPPMPQDAPALESESVPPVSAETDQTEAAPDQETTVSAEEAAAKIQEAKEEAEEELAILDPPIPERAWTFGKGDFEKTYIQCELSVIGSAQWFKLLGEVLEDAMTGDNAMSLNSLLSPPTPGQQGRFQMQDFQEADMFVTALGKLLTVMPEFLEKSICIWLDVPDYEQELITTLMRRSPTKGGMSHDMFEEIVTTFIDQNYAEIDRFFRERFPRLRDRYRARAKEASQSRSRKP